MLVAQTVTEVMYNFDCHWFLIPSVISSSSCL